MARLINAQTEKFIAELEAYKARRLAVVPSAFRESLEHYKTHFFGFSFGYSAKEKVTAVDLLIKSLKGEKVEFSERQLEALRNSELGTIIGRNKKLLPVAFKQQENLRIFRGMRELGRR